jgi:hypothetical protein
LNLSPVKARALLIAVVVANFLSALPSTLALTIIGHRITGIIQKVDAGTREAELLAAGTSKPVRFTWDRETRFITKRQIADATMLRPGALVEITCFSPFFGQTYVKKVTFISVSFQQGGILDPAISLSGISYGLIMASEDGKISRLTVGDSRLSDPDSLKIS